MTTERSWHVGRWGPLGWLETALKGGAIVCGLAAFARAVGDDLAVPSGARLAQWIVMIVLTLGLVGAIADRVAEREIVGMAFVIPNVAAHAGMTVALMGDPGPGSLLVAFAALMLAGDLVKIAFLTTTGFTVRSISPRVVVGLTTFYAASYALLLILDAV